MARQFGIPKLILAVRMAVLLSLGCLAMNPAVSQAHGEWLSLCGQCVNPRVFAKSGIGTAHAVAQGRITFKDARDNCLNFAAPGSDAECAKQAHAAVLEEKGKVYRASADCLAGRISAIDGKQYMLAGKWTKAGDIGFGRSRWRDSGGAIVGSSEADGGLAIAQQWELLCPAAKRPPIRP